MEEHLNAKGFKIIFWNTRSILNKIEGARDKIRDFLPDVMVITESWLKENIPDSVVNIAGYSIHRYDRTFRNNNGFVKKGGGIIVYIRNDHPHMHITGDIFNKSCIDIESTTISIKGPHTRPLYLIATYRPPNGNSTKAVDYLDNLLKCLPNLEKADLIMGGDFNIDFSKTRKENTKKLKHLSTKYNLTQYIKTPTRPIDNDSVIDLIFADCRFVQNTGVLTWNFSDHLPTYMTIKKSKKVFKKEQFKGRSYRNFNEDIFIHTIEHLDWATFNDTINVNTQWDILYKNVLTTLDDIIPIKKISFPNSKPEWMFGDLIEYMKDRDAALKKAIRTKNPVDKKLARKARNRVNVMIRNAKNIFVKEKLEQYEDNSKKFWEQIKSVMPNTKLSNPVNLMDDEGNKLNNLDSASAINSYFTNIGALLASELKKEHPANEEPNPVQLPVLVEILNLQQPTFLEISKWVKQIKTFKSSGLTKISSRIWKLLFNRVPFVLTRMVETIFNTCVFPQKWKHATVIPLPKVTNITGPEDLRPISLLPLPRKIVEHLLYTQIDHFLEAHALLTDKQNGFRTKRSTVYTIFDFTSDLLTSYNDNLNVIAIYIDFKKAFDTVNHKKLINKLKNFNFSENLIKLLQNYLDNRSQSTCMGGECSTSLNMTYGVPQGSVLGPKLFLLYLNDLVEVIEYCDYYMYVDDIVLFKKIRNDDHYTNIDIGLFKQDVQGVSEGCVANELTINIKKTKVQYFPSNRNSKCQNFENSHQICIKNKSLDYVSSYKYLGIELDRNMNMKGQFEYLFKIVNHKLFLLKTII